MQKWYMSVADPSALALTVRGMLVGFVPVVLTLLKLIGHEVAPADAQVLIDAIVNVVSAIAGVVSVVITAIGLFRKFYHYYIKKDVQQNPFTPQ